MTSFKTRLNSRTGLTLAGALLFGLGGLTGAATTLAVRPPVAMAPAAPVPIASLAAAATPWLGEPVVTVRGRIAEVYGGRFIVADRSGRALVEAGPAGAGALAANQVVTVQGRYEDGVIRARFLVGPDGRVAALDPHFGPGRGRHGPHGGPPPAPDGPEPVA